jgi:cytochrome P450
MIGGYEMPEGVSPSHHLRNAELMNTKTIVSAWISEMQRDPQIWPDPEAFVPERWLGEYKGVEANRKAFMPFSAGTRNCIGQQ